MPAWGKLARLGSTLAGGVGGVATADEDDNLLLHGLGGAALGGMVAPGALGALSRAGGVADKARQYTYFSMLSSPDTMARASLGAVGGAANGALDRILSGLTQTIASGGQQGQDSLRQGAAILTDLFSPSTALDYVKFLRDPVALQRAYTEIMPELAALDVEQHGMAALGRSRGALGRFYAVPDLLAVRAMKRGGFAADEAARYTLSGSPASALGKAVMGARDAMRKSGPVGSIVADQIAPFARVGVLGLEKGMERLPLLGPALLGRGPLGGMSKQLQGLGAGIAGYQSEDQVDPRILEVLGPLAGPAFLPYAAGRNLRDERQRGEGWGGAALGAVEETLKELSPLGAQPGSIFYRAESEIPRRLIPSGMADVAEALDPEDWRETGPQRIRERVASGRMAEPTLMGLTGDWLGGAPVAATARIPGLREELPAAPAPVDIFGQPRADPLAGDDAHPLLRALERVMAPARQRALDPALNVEDPRAAILHSLGIAPGPPSTAVNIPGLGLPFEQTPESAAAVQANRGLAREIAAHALASDPRLQGPDSPAKRQIARDVYRRITSYVNRLLSGLNVPLSVMGGASLPMWIQSALRSGALAPDTPASGQSAAGPPGSIGQSPRLG